MEPGKNLGWGFPAIELVNYRLGLLRIFLRQDAQERFSPKVEDEWMTSSPMQAYVCGHVGVENRAMTLSCLLNDGEI